MEFDCNFKLVTLTSTDRDPALGPLDINLLIITHEEADQLFEYLNGMDLYRGICCTANGECAVDLNLPSNLAKVVMKLEAKATFMVEESGYFYILAVNCHMTPLIIEGTIDVVNPYGYVPGIDGKLLVVRI